MYVSLQKVMPTFSDICANSGSGLVKVDIIAAVCQEFILLCDGPGNFHTELSVNLKTK